MLARVPVTTQSLSIVLPAYEEEENIAVVLERALEVLPEIAERFEILVVDDGSNDATADAAARVAVDAPAGAIRVLRHTANAGYGSAIRTGFQHATGDLVFYTDADNQFDLGELRWFVPLIADHDVVVGFRVYRYDTVLRCVLSWGYNRLVSLLFRVRVRDVDCAYKLFRREVVEKIDIECQHFFVDTELVAKSRRWNFRIAEKGVRHYPRPAGATTVIAGDIRRTLREVTRMWIRIYFPRARSRVTRPDSRTDEHAIRVVELALPGRA